MTLGWAAGALSATAGMGVWLVVVGTWLLTGRAEALGNLVGALTAALLVGGAFLGGAGPLVGLCAAATMAAVLGLPERARSEGPRVPWGVAAATSVVAGGWMLLTHALPFDNLVVPRPLEESVRTAGALAVVPMLAAALSRTALRGPPAGGLVLAGALVLLRVASLVLPAWPDDTQAQVARVLELRGLGLHALAANRVEDAMVAAQQRGDAAVVSRWFDEATRDQDETRRRPRVLWAAAWAAEQRGENAWAVDALLKRALLRMEAPAAELDTWPGNTRAREAALRAEARVLGALWPDAPRAERSDARECFGGSVCLVGWDLPALKQGPPGTLVLHWRKVAPLAGPLNVHVLCNWRGWEMEVPLRGADAAAVGGRFATEVTVPMDAADGQDHEVRIWLLAPPGGPRVGMRNRPGTDVMLDHAQPDRVVSWGIPQ